MIRYLIGLIYPGLYYITFKGNQPSSTLKTVLYLFLNVITYRDNYDHGKHSSTQKGYTVVLVAKTINRQIKRAADDRR